MSITDPCWHIGDALQTDSPGLSRAGHGRRVVHGLSNYIELGWQRLWGMLHLRKPLEFSLRRENWGDPPLEQRSPDRAGPAHRRLSPWMQRPYH